MSRPLDHTTTSSCRCTWPSRAADGWIAVAWAFVGAAVCALARRRPCSRPPADAGTIHVIALRPSAGMPTRNWPQVNSAHAIISFADRGQFPARWSRAHWSNCCIAKGMSPRGLLRSLSVADNLLTDLSQRFGFTSESRLPLPPSSHSWARNPNWGVRRAKLINIVR